MKEVLQRSHFVEETKGDSPTPYNEIIKPINMIAGYLYELLDDNLQDKLKTYTATLKTPLKKQPDNINIEGKLIEFEDDRIVFKIVVPEGYKVGCDDMNNIAVVDPKTEESISSDVNMDEKGNFTIKLKQPVPIGKGCQITFYPLAYLHRYNGQITKAEYSGYFYIVRK